MLNIDMAKSIVQKTLPGRRIASYIEYKDLFIFQAFDDSDPIEGQMDPFYSVNKNTGEFKEFSILTDGNAEVMSLFVQAQST